MSAPSDPTGPIEGPAISIESLKYAAGDVIADKYTLIELMGKGGMGSVWRAKNSALGVDVAIKLVHGDLASPEMTERLKREAHAAAKLEHPSAVRVFDLGESELGDPFIVMELLRGESLRDLFERRHQMAPKEIVPLVLPIASALSAAHQKGIVHRDLKPENVLLVDHDGRTIPKVVDFGLAKVDSPAFDRRSTREGTILGSPDYMAPEQARGDVEHMDARTDVWALAIVLYEALAGRPPFDADHPLALLRAIIEDPVPKLEPLGLADAKLSAIIEKALEKKPDDRFLDMRAFGRALAEWSLANGVDTDVTGASIAAHWTRGSRASLTSASLPLPVARLTPNPDDAPPSSDAAVPPTLGAAVWQASGRPRSRVGLTVAVGLGAAALGVVAVIAISHARSPSSPPSSSSPSSSSSSPSSLSSSSSPSPSSSSSSSPSSPSSTPSSSTPSSSASPLALASAAPSASASSPSSASLLAPEPGACIQKLFGDDAFEADAPLDKVCVERDPRRGAQLLRGEIARHGLVQKRTTEPMRQWALLSWYELATFSIVRGSCCPTKELTALELPPAIGTCLDMGPLLEELQRDAKSGIAERAISDFRTAAVCIDRGRRVNAGMVSPYSYEGPPGGGAETAFRRILQRLY